MRIGLSRGVVAVALAFGVLLSAGAWPALAGRGEAGSAGAGNLLRVEVQGGPASGLGYVGATQDTRSGDLFYVSNQPSAYNRVRVQVRAPAGTTGLQASVTNLDQIGQALTLPLAQGPFIESVAGQAHHWYQGVFHVVASSPGQEQLLAADGHRVRVSYEGSQVELRIDGTPPTLTNVLPSEVLHTAQTSVNFRATIRDSGSGMRADRACSPGASGPGCASDVPPFADISVDWADANQNGLTGAEPRMFTYGGAADVRLRLSVGGASTDFSDLDPSRDLTQQITYDQGWTALSNGFSFTLLQTLPVGANSITEFRWVLQARDRAGNLATEVRTISVDTASPRLGTAEWGIGYDASVPAETDNHPRWIKLTFVNSSHGSPETLNPGTIVAGNFSVPDNSVVEALFVAGDDPGGAGDAVYLRLAEPPQPGVVPMVQVSSGVRDMAGNQSVPHSLQAVNTMLARLTVTMSGAYTVNGLPVARGEEPGQEMVVRVEADRPLTGAPTITVQRFVYDGRSGATVRGVKLVEAREVFVVTPVPGSPNVWQARLNGVEVGGPGLFGVWVEAMDASGEIVTSGAGGRDVDSWIFTTQAVDLTRAHLGIMEPALAPANVRLLPGSNSTTQSRSPFLNIDFLPSVVSGIPRTAGDFQPTGEYVLAFDCGAPAPASPVRCVPAPGSPSEVGGSPTRLDLGTHRSVELTNLTLNGATVMDRAARTGDGSFLLSLSGLSLGQHTLRFNGRDAAGNTYSTAQTFSFTVEERGPYRVPLALGWNLVSLPGRPENADINSVFPAGHPATSVLAYVQGQWLVATRGDGGRWEGTLTTISGSVAYWVQASSVAAIETPLLERVPTDPPPAVPVMPGWNLVPVIDMALAPAGSNPGGAPTPVLAADYFATIHWAVAYAYNTQEGRWDRITPFTTSVVAQIKNGRGYWVYVLSPGVLVL